MNDPLRDQLIERLEVENDELRERVRQLEAQLFGAEEDLPIEFRLSPHERQWLRCVLARKGVVTRSALMCALYSGGSIDREPEQKIVDVFACKIRRKLAPFGIKIVTSWGEGYSMPEASKAIIRTMQGKLAA